MPGPGNPGRMSLFDHSRSRRMFMAQPIYQVDAFTNKPYAGNPAGVCILPKKASEEWMKSVAQEMNLSETAFLLPLEDAGKERSAGSENKTDKERMAEDTQTGKGQ